MLHSKIKIFSMEQFDNYDQWEKSKRTFEDDVNSFMKDKNVKSIVRMSPYTIIVHYTDSTY